MEKLMEDIIIRNKKYIDEGVVADYIPALSKADINHIGLCIIDKDDNIYKMGNHDIKFTIQSISKVITLILALMDNGKEYVFDRVGYQGTDEPFNTMYKLDLPHIDKPANPMINSGAILTTSLVKGKGMEKYNRILDLTRIMAKNENIIHNEEVYISERDTGDKNKSIGYLLKANNMMDGDVDEILNAYFKQCSMEVDAVDLANIARFLSNGCKGLDSYGKIDREELSQIVLSIMMNCGMYDFSSEYGSTVGLPSKSGVAGGIMSVVPNDMGIGVYSPGLDEYGNSKVSYEILKDLSKELKLSVFI